MRAPKARKLRIRQRSRRPATRRMLTSCWNATFASSEWLGFDGARAAACLGLAVGARTGIGAAASWSMAHWACASRSLRSGDGHDEDVGHGRTRPILSTMPVQRADVAGEIQECEWHAAFGVRHIRVGATRSRH